MKPDALGLLGLMRRAGKLAAGEDGVRQAVRAGKAKLILLASDASQNAKDRAEGFATRSQISLQVLPADKATLSQAAGVAGGAMFAVCDEGFAAALQKKLQTDPAAEQTV